MYKSIIIGGGTSGLACACFCDKNTLIIDKQKIGKKLSISGNSRINFTNLADFNDFLRSYAPNGDFLRDAFKVFFKDDLISFINELGFKTQVENNKVFLSGSKGNSFVNALKKYILNKKIQIHENEKVVKIEKKFNFIVYTDHDIYESKNIVVATGGLSYKQLGASADGYMFARSFGHKIIPPKPYETPFCIRDNLFENLNGISLKNVQIKHKNKIFNNDLLFTHFGLSGPVILDISCHVKNGDAVYINFLGEKKEEFLNKLTKTKKIKPLIKEYLPKRFIDNLIKKMPFLIRNIEEISKKDLNLIFSLLFNYEIIVKLCGFNKAFVTKGGVNLSEVDPKTCQSKIVNGLFFCGEVLDIAGSIGGFNIQAAFSTGYIVAQKLGNLPFTNI
ncbi:MAG: NAD(P)/FAD-dependent oxidoreductase [Desulfurella sp.]|uniref:NAD(P)/FAD-dependent oxidoreductase n=1 Tax=Desulfurella sp. TaxID=1962857 RepID=UPI003C9DBF26